MHRTEPLRRPRILLIAYSCSPSRGSEPAVGWNRAVEAARYCDTWVIVEERSYGPDVRRYLEAHGDIPGLHFEFVPRGRPEQVLRRIGAGYYLAYNIWHRRAYRAARRLHARLRFDLVQQVTFIGYREPSYLWKLDVPFVWGPVGGAQNFPWRFLPEAGVRGAIAETTRNLLNSVQLRWSPRVRAAARKAIVLLAGSTNNQRDLARAHGVEPILFPGNGISRVSAPFRLPQSGHLRIVWSGILHPLKGLPLLLKALARLPRNVSYEVRIVGDGPSRRRWQRLADRLGVGSHVTWTGWLPHEEALRQYSWADVCVFTSLRETLPTVVLEALGSGLPVICLDHLGMGDAITEDCGIKIAVTTRRQVVGALAGAIARLAGDPAERIHLSRGARDRAKHYLWSENGRRMAEIYRQVLGDRFAWAERDTRAACETADRPARSCLAVGEIRR